MTPHRAARRAPLGETRAARRMLLPLVLACLVACGDADVASSPSLGETSATGGVPRPLIDARRRATVCPVHGEPLIETQIPVTYGFPYFDSPSYDSVACPYVGEFVSGGCGGGFDGDTQRALVTYCLQCRAERPRRYAAANPDENGPVAPGEEEPRMQSVETPQPRR